MGSSSPCLPHPPVSYLHAHLAIPVIAKLRVFPTLDRTLAYASHVFSSGAQLLTIHGRTREAKGRQAGFASWSKINAVTSLLGPSVPILANGGIPNGEDVEPCLRETGAVGVMSAEGNLYNPMLFSPLNAAGGRAYRLCLPTEMQEALLKCDEQLVGEWDRDAAVYTPATYLAAQYLAIVRTLPSTRTSPSAIKAHLFKLFRPIWAAGRYMELREALGSAGKGVGTAEGRVDEYEKVVEEMHKAIQVFHCSFPILFFPPVPVLTRSLPGRPRSRASTTRLAPTTQPRRSNRQLRRRHSIFPLSTLFPSRCRRR